MIILIKAELKAFDLEKSSARTEGLSSTLNGYHV